jgi:hydrogenase-4 component E
MHDYATQFFPLFETVIFAAALILHLVKKNSSAVWLYAVQSGAVGFMLLMSSTENSSVFLLVAILATITVKVIVAPAFLFGLLRRYPLKFSSSTYLSNPLTLLVIALLVAGMQTRFSASLLALAPGAETLLLASLAGILISFLLIINRKGALSQIIGILSVENSIVSFAVLAGLEQNPALQLGITFDILVWAAIATVFIAMIYRQFGTLDVTSMRELTG